MNCITIADEIANQLNAAIQILPEDFFDSFAYTQTGNNLTHPLTWGILTKILWDLPNIAQVGIDVRINNGRGVKFQPDLTGYSTEGAEIVFVDYESPNSSDARIPGKDVDAYLAWRDKSKVYAPYLIITTLPNYYSPNWELRYTSKGSYNFEFRGQRNALRQNPCVFWYDYYLSEFNQRKMEGIVLLNISGKTVHRKFPA